MKDKIGIILTTKQRLYFDYCIASIRNQIVKPAWIVLALEEDENLDDFNEIAQYDDIKIIQSEKTGVVNARNTAIDYIKSNLQSDYIAILTSNMYLYPAYLNRLLLTATDETDFAYCGYEIINTRVGGSYRVMPSPFDPELLLEESYIPVQSLIKTESIVKFSEDVGELYDWDFFLQLKNKKGVLCNQILFDFLGDNDHKLLDTFLLRKKYPEIKQEQPDEEIEGVAFIMQNINSYSGGRIHSWLQALSIAELDIPITVYTDKLPPFIHDFPMYKQPKIKVCDLEKLNVKADLYWSSPYLGHVKALQLSNIYDKWSVQPFFDPPDWQKKYHDGKSFESAIVNPIEYKRQYEIYKHDKIKILSSTHNGIQGYVGYYGFNEKDISVLPPPINSRMIDVFDQWNIERKNWIVSTNRNVPSKAWDEALGAFIPYMDKYKFVIITNNANSILEKADKFGIPRNRLIIRDGGIPDSEKFLIFLQSKIMLVASHFEGFGMHLTEAMATDLEYVSYRLPPLEEIYSSIEHKHRIHFAEYGNIKSLRQKLGEAIKNTEKNGRFIPETTSLHEYSFNHISEETRKIISQVLS